MDWGQFALWLAISAVYVVLMWAAAATVYTLLLEKSAHWRIASVSAVLLAFVFGAGLLVRLAPDSYGALSAFWAGLLLGLLPELFYHDRILDWFIARRYPEYKKISG